MKMRREIFLGNAACQSLKSARSSQASKSVTIGCLQCLPVLMSPYRLSTSTVQSRDLCLLVDLIDDPSKRRIADPNHELNKKSCEI